MEADRALESVGVMNWIEEGMLTFCMVGGNWVSQCLDGDTVPAGDSRQTIILAPVWVRESCLERASLIYVCMNIAKGGRCCLFGGNDVLKW